MHKVIKFSGKNFTKTLHSWIRTHLYYDVTNTRLKNITMHSLPVQRVKNYYSARRRVHSIYDELSLVVQSRACKSGRFLLTVARN